MWITTSGAGLGRGPSQALGPDLFVTSGPGFAEGGALLEGSCLCAGQCVCLNLVAGHGVLPDLELMSAAGQRRGESRIKSEGVL